MQDQRWIELAARWREERESAAVTRETAQELRAEAAERIAEYHRLREQLATSRSARAKRGAAGSR
jgi:hypothetical protein